MANRIDFGTSLVATAPSPATSGTSLMVTAGQGVDFPAAPFWATVAPFGVLPNLSNAEIILVTAVSTDTFTITRSQKGTSAQSIAIGWSISNVITAEDVTPVGTILSYGGRTAPTGYLLCYGQNVSRTTYAALFQTVVPLVGNPTISIASPGVVTLNGHGFVNGDTVFFTTTGALPTGLSANTIYYVVSAATNTFEVASTYGGTAINTSGTQSGTHSVYACPYGLGDGSTTFGIPDLRGRVAAGADAMGGTAASRLTNNSFGTQGLYGNAGQAGGEQSHTQVVNELVSHTHSSTNAISQGNTRQYTQLGTDSGLSSSWSSTATGGGSAMNVVQPTIVTNRIIKT